LGRTLPVLLLAAFLGLVQEKGPPPPKTPTRAPGRLVPSESMHSFGEVFRGETVCTTFVLTNQGPGDLTINEVRTCCTCSSAAMTIAGRKLTTEETAKAKQLGTLKADEHAELEVVLDTLDPGCGAHDGRVTKYVSIYHTDPGANPLTLSLEANLVTPYTLEPAALDFGRVRQGQDAKVNCVLSGGRLGEFKILGTKLANDDLVKVAFERLPGEADAPATYRIEASLLPSATVGAHVNHVELEIDHARVKAISIPVRAVVELAGPSR
jgi:hypothetical protein